MHSSQGMVVGWGSRWLSELGRSFLDFPALIITSPSPALVLWTSWQQHHLLGLYTLCIMMHIVLNGCIGKQLFNMNLQHQCIDVPEPFHAHICSVMHQSFEREDTSTAAALMANSCYKCTTQFFIAIYEMQWLALLFNLQSLLDFQLVTPKIFR